MEFQVIFLFFWCGERERERERFKKVPIWDGGTVVELELFLNQGFRVYKNLNLGRG